MCSELVFKKNCLGYTGHYMVGVGRGHMYRDSLEPVRKGRKSPFPKGPKYLYGTKYDFCSSNFPYGLGKYSPYGYLGPFGFRGKTARP